MKMEEMVELVILAKSIKHRGYCVAGKCVAGKKNGEWIRVVSDEKGKELTYEQAMACNANDIKPLDKVKINLIKPEPLPHQPENHLNDQTTTWVSNYQITLDQLEQYLDSPTDLWGSNSNRILYEDIENGKVKINNSLYLIRVHNIETYQYTTDEGKVKRRVSFDYNSVNYCLPVTDPEFDDIKSKELNNPILCISLGENHENYCYKIVAKIFYL